MTSSWVLTTKDTATAVGGDLWRAPTLDVVRPAAKGFVFGHVPPGRRRGTMNPHGPYSSMGM